MGQSRGAYIGGCTVIGPKSGWFTGVKPRSRKVAKPPIALTETRAAIIHQVISATLKNEPLPELPKRARNFFAKEVAAVGILAWAPKQPEYAAIYRAKLAKAGR